MRGHFVAGRFVGVGQRPEHGDAVGGSHVKNHRYDWVGKVKAERKRKLRVPERA